jgi:CheY-like chemotaxis protein
VADRWQILVVEDNVELGEMLSEYFGELGAADYITKPFDVEELALRVRNILWRSQSHAPTNPITGLPEGQPVRERLERMLDQPEWALIVAGLRGYDAFRNIYGFIAAVTASSISLIAQVTGLSSKGHHIATLEDLRIALESSY